MALLCNRQLSPLQRRTMGFFGANLGLTAALSMVTHDFFKPDHLSLFLSYLLATITTIPVIGIIAVVSRYLKRENDEFVRMIVVQAILWGLGVVMAVDTFLGGLLIYPSLTKLIPILNIDLFCVVTGVAVRVQLWRNR
jgi:hypothetical protein